MSSLLAWSGAVPHDIGRTTTAPDTLRPGLPRLPPRPAPWTVSNFAALADGAQAVLGTDVNLSARRAQRFGGVAPAASSFGLRVEHPAI